MDTPLLEEAAPPPAPPARRGLGLSREDSYLASRPDYFANLRRGSVPNLHLAPSDDVSDGADGGDGEVFGIGDLVKRQKRSSLGLGSSRLSAFSSGADGGDAAVSELRQRLGERRKSETARGKAEEVHVQVALRDYSYHVPVREDAPSIKTVFNQSPCYAASSFLVNVGELITGSRKVRGDAARDLAANEGSGSGLRFIDSSLISACSLCSDNGSVRSLREEVDTQGR